MAISGSDALAISPQKKPRSFPGEKSTGALSQRSVKYYSGGE